MNYFVIDFDSTFIKTESLDELFRISNPIDKDLHEKINKITSDGMEGKLSFSQSLSNRIEILNANKDDIKKTINEIRDKISDSFKSNKDFFKKNKEYIYIVSSGFHEIIDPIVLNYHIPKKNIYANNFFFDGNGKIIGFDKKNPLSKTKGKVEIIKNLKLNGTIHVLGDGYTDFEIKKDGYADYFYLFIENIKRESLTKNADFLVKSFDHFKNIVK